jgi:WD40 repeat protein
MHGNGLTIDATSRWLVTAGGFSVNAESEEETVTIWDLHNKDIAATARSIKQKGDVWQVAVSPNCEWLFTARMNGEVQLWDLRDGCRVPHPLLHCGQSAAISPDGRWLAAGGRVQFDTLLFDLKSKEPWNSARVLHGHEAPVWALAFSNDSRWLVTDSSDGTVRRWCMDTDWLLQHAQNAVGREMTQQEREHHGIENPSAR